MTSGSAVADTTPPTPYGGATLARVRTSEVTLDAEDSDGGVAHLYYRVGSGGEKAYTRPFTVPMFSTVSFRAMDTAGNMSAESSLVADDAPSSQRFADPLTPSRPVIRFIDPQGRRLVHLPADGRSRYRVQLDELPADYDVQLFDADGTVVAAPRAHGHSPRRSSSCSLPARTR